MLDKSVKSAPKELPLFADNFHFSSMAKRQYYVLYHFLNRHWYFESNGSICFEIYWNKSFKNLWYIWEYANWSVIILWLSIMFLKNRGNICVFKARWKNGFCNRLIGTKDKIGQNISILLDDFSWYICTLTCFWKIYLRYFLQYLCPLHRRKWKI